MVDTLNYTEGETSNYTHLNFYKYVRPRPNAALQRTPTGFITLPLPINLPADYYSMDVSGTNLGLAGNLSGITNGEDLTRVKETLRERLNAEGNLGGAGFTAKDIGNMIAAAVGSAPAIADFGRYLTPNVIDTIASTTGYVRNPHAAVIFNNVNLRQFTLHWRLSPRSQTGSQTLNNIIKLIKQKMHPALGPGGFSLDYPNLVTASFNNDKEGIVNIDYSFISDFHIDPTSQGHIYYKEGYPTFVDMQMTLKEIRIKTAEDFSTNPSGQV